jgi:hypothetical protein
MQTLEMAVRTLFPAFVFAAAVAAMSMTLGVADSPRAEEGCFPDLCFSTEYGTDARGPFVRIMLHGLAGEKFNVRPDPILQMTQQSVPFDRNSGAYIDLHVPGPGTYGIAAQVCDVPLVGRDDCGALFDFTATFPAPAKEVVDIAPAGQRSVDTDLLGSDYSSVAVANVFDCQYACNADNNCLAWTFVREGIKGDSAMCYFKNPVPATAYRDPCCISGLSARKYVEEPQPEAATEARPVRQMGKARARVTADVDLYDEPEGEVRDFLAEGTIVRSSAAKCVDGWCPVFGDNVPGGSGWVWGEFLDYN